LPSVFKVSKLNCLLAFFLAILLVWNENFYPVVAQIPRANSLKNRAALMTQALHGFPADAIFAFPTISHQSNSSVKSSSATYFTLPSHNTHPYSGFLCKTTKKVNTYHFSL